ncbi:MAG: DUF4870 domain-containing protein [Acidobacteriota bacterium]|nr:DUF4870 domain-containing protein [Acidobacteriota bacterium]
MNDNETALPPPPPPSSPQPPPPGGADSGQPGDADALTAMWAHIIGAVLSLICLTAPFGWAPALLIYLFNKDKSRFVAFHSLQALFFFGAIGVANFGLWVFGMFGLFLLTAPLSLLINIGGAVYGVFVGIKAKDGLWTEYMVAGELARKQLS